LRTEGHGVRSFVRSFVRAFVRSFVETAWHITHNNTVKANCFYVFCLIQHSKSV
jgi:hypothetical protein